MTAKTYATINIKKLEKESPQEREGRYGQRNEQEAQCPKAGLMGDGLDQIGTQLIIDTVPNQ